MFCSHTCVWNVFNPLFGVRMNDRVTIGNIHVCHTMTGEKDSCLSFRSTSGLCRAKCDRSNAKHTLGPSKRANYSAGDRQHVLEIMQPIGYCKDGALFVFVCTGAFLIRVDPHSVWCIENKYTHTAFICVEYWTKLERTRNDFVVKYEDNYNIYHKKVW